ncbi:hypothetical protein AAZX31_02G190900 [Glycine max]
MSNLKQRLHTLGHRVLSFQPHCPINRTKISPLCNIILWYFSPSIIKTHTFKFQLFSPPHGSQIQITGTLSLSTEWEMLCPLSSSSLYTCVRLPPKGTPFFQEDSLRNFHFYH